MALSIIDDFTETRLASRDHSDSIVYGLTERRENKISEGKVPKFLRRRVLPCQAQRLAIKPYHPPRSLTP